MVQRIQTRIAAPLLACLSQRGWARHIGENADTEAILKEMRKIGRLLGRRSTGRAGALEEIVYPKRSKDAHPQSLSAKYGLSALPFHAELSHRGRPCRYVLLGCIDPGSPSVATMLVDWRKLDFSPEELQILEGAPILVRNGRRSFYSTILATDRNFLRFDPGCIEAVEKRGEAALTLVKSRLADGTQEAYHWSRGDILVIDNWRILHGRAHSSDNSGRRLARMVIDG